MPKAKSSKPQPQSQPSSLEHSAVSHSEVLQGAAQKSEAAAAAASLVANKKMLQEMEAAIKKLNQLIDANSLHAIVQELKKNHFDEDFTIPADFGLGWLMTIGKAWALVAKMMQADPVLKKPPGIVSIYLRKEYPPARVMLLLRGAYLFCDTEDGTEFYLCYVDDENSKGAALSSCALKGIPLRDVACFKQVLASILDGSTAQKISLTPDQYQRLIIDNVISIREKYRKAAIHYFSKVLQTGKLSDSEKVLLQRSDVYAEGRQFDLAIADLDALLAKKPGSSQALMRRGDCYLESKQFELAQADFQTMLRIDPQSADGHYGLAKALWYQSKVNEALDVTEKMIKRSEFMAAGMTLRAKILLTRAEAEQTAQTEQSSADYKQAMGLLLKILQQNNRAIHGIFKVIQHDPCNNKDKLIILELCEDLFEAQPKSKKNVEMMAFYLNRIISLTGPDETLAMLRKGLLACEQLHLLEGISKPELNRLQATLCKQYAHLCDSPAEKKDHYEKALELYSSVLAYDPDNWQILNELGRIIALLGDFDKSLLHFRQSLQKRPENNLDAHLGWANASIAQEDVVTAYHQLQCASRLNPEDPVASRLLSQLEFECGDYASARLYTQKAQLHAPDDVYLQTRLRAIDFYTGQTGGLARMKKLLKKHPKHPYILGILGMIQNACGNYVRGLEYLEQVTIDEPPQAGQIRVLRAKAVALHQLSRLQEAADCLQLTFLRKEWADALVQYAVLNYQLGHPEVAWQTLEKVFPWRGSDLLEFSVITNDVEKAQAALKALLRLPLLNKKDAYSCITHGLELLALLYLDRALVEKESQASALACAALNVLLSAYPTHKSALVLLEQIHLAQAVQLDENNDLAREHHQQLVDARCDYEAQMTEASEPVAAAQSPAVAKAYPSVLTAAADVPDSLQAPAPAPAPAPVPVSIPVPAPVSLASASNFWKNKPNTVVQDRHCRVSLPVVSHTIYI